MLLFRNLSKCVLIASLISSSTFADVPRLYQEPGESFISQNEAQLRDAIQSAASTPLLKQYVDSVVINRARHTLDRSVFHFITSNPTALQFYKAAEQELAEVTKLYRRQHRGNTGRAGPNQFSREYHAAADLAKIIGFSDQAVKELALFIDGSNTVNAYTYSGLLEMIDVAVFQGLKSIMTPDEFDAVVAHELGHIRLRHVLMGVVVDAIFWATGEIVIANADQTTKEKFRTIADHGARRIIAMSRGLSTKPDYVEQMLAVGHKVGLSFASRLKISDGSVDQLKLYELAAGLSESMGVEGDAVKLLRSATAEASLAANQPPKISKEQLKEFNRAMERLTRSQETSADQIALVTKGRATSGAMAKLAGGQDIKLEEFLRQYEEYVREVPDVNEREDYIGGDHPGIAARAAHWENYAKLLDYKILKSSFLTALDLYLRLTYQLARSEATLVTNTAEMSELHFTGATRTLFTNYAEKLSTALQNVLLEEARTAQSIEEMPYFRLMNEYTGQARQIAGVQGVVRPQELTILKVDGPAKTSAEFHGPLRENALWLLRQADLQRQGRFASGLRSGLQEIVKSNESAKRTAIANALLSYVTETFGSPSSTAFDGLAGAFKTKEPDTSSQNSGKGDISPSPGSCDGLKPGK